MIEIAGSLLCWLCIWAIGRYFIERDKRKKRTDERDDYGR